MRVAMHLSFAAGKKEPLAEIDWAASGRRSWTPACAEPTIRFTLIGSGR